MVRRREKTVLSTRIQTESPALAWVNGRESTTSGESIELAALPDGQVAIRNNWYPDGLWLMFDQDAARAFIAGAKAGVFDHLLDDDAPRQPVQGPCT